MINEYPHKKSKLVIRKKRTIEIDGDNNGSSKLAEESKDPVNTNQ